MILPIPVNLVLQTLLNRRHQHLPTRILPPLIGVKSQHI
jgi:Mg2+ and Co2+ transporter CorA